MSDWLPGLLWLALCAVVAWLAWVDDGREAL